MENKKENKSIVNFFSFADAKPNVPKFSEFNGRAKWIEYGDDNLYPDFLVSLSNASSKHSALLMKEANMTAGEGWKKDGSIEGFIANDNGKEDLDLIAFKNANDLCIYGAYAIAITWSKDKSSIARISYVDVRKIRIAKEVDETEDAEMYKRQQDGVTFYYISADWSNTRKEKNKPELIQGFSEKYKDEATQLIYVTQYRSGTEWYTLPQYISAINWIQLDEEIANFHISSVQNGFTPSMIISFQGGIPTEEEMDSIHRDIQRKYAGTDNASRVFLTFSEDSTTSPEFIPIEPNSSDERFIQLEQSIQSNIIIAHGASPIVAGIATAGKLGSSDEIFEAEMVFKNNVISPKQKLIENVYNKIARINGIETKMELEGISSIDEMENGVVSPEAVVAANKMMDEFYEKENF